MRLILAFVFVALFLFGCDRKTSNNMDSDLTKVLNNAIDKKNFSLCANLGKTDKRICYYAYAQNTNETEACDQIDIINSDISDSRNGCYLQIARNTKDPLVCEKMQLSGEENLEIKNLCYYEMAIATKDPKLCEKMTGDYIYYCPPCPQGAVCTPCKQPATKLGCKDSIE